MEQSYASSKEGEYSGGIIAVSDDDVYVNNCRFGGKIGTTKTIVDVTANNVADLAIGNNLGRMEGISLWDGK